MKYILWDPKDGEPRRDEDGAFLTDGLIGRIGPDNVYLTAYAKVLRTPIAELHVGGVTEAEFSLSGSKGTYRIYRVE